MSKKLDPIEAQRQKMAAKLLEKRMHEAAAAQANLERAMEMSQSVDVRDLELGEDDLEVDDADLYDIDLDQLDMELDEETIDDLEILQSRDTSSEDRQVAASRISQRFRARQRECPMCAEVIKSRARICRFCRHDLGGSETKGAPITRIADALGIERGPAHEKAVAEALARLAAAIPDIVKQDEGSKKAARAALAAFAFLLADMLSDD